VIFSKRNLESLKVNLEEFITIKGIKAQGNQLTTEKIKQVNLLEPLPFEEPEEEPTEDVDVVDEEVIREVLPLEIDELKVVLPIEQELSTDEKANIALQKSIARKKAEQKKIDDENQTKLF
jgi:topoisomerase IV subunit A